MLLSTGSFFNAGGGGAGGPSGGVLTYQNSNVFAGSAASHTYSSAPLGSADAGRLIIVAIAGRRSSVTPRTISTVTIGGISATVVQIGRTGSTGGLTVGIAYAVVPTGTTWDVVVTYSGTLSESTISVYSLVGHTSSTPADTLTVNTGDNPSGGIDAADNGIIVGSFAGIDGTLGDITIVGATENYDATNASLRAAAAGIDGLSVQTNRTISMSASMTTEALVAVSWA